VQAGVSLSVLGGFTLQVDGQKGPDLPRKTRALLALLAVDNARPVSRETAAELIWPGRGPEQSKNSLKEALYRLREPLRAYDVVVSQDGDLALGAAVATDVATFRRLADAQELAALHGAADAYAGPLMAGFRTVEDDFNDWLALSRAALEKTALSVLARTADLCTAGGDFAGTMAAAERMFAIDRLDEEIHARLLEACAAAGRRAEALRHYESIAEVLKRDLGTTPGAQTRAIKQRLRQEMDPPVRDAPVRLEPVPYGSPPPIAVLPFVQLGEETVASHLADGILVDTVCQLAGLRELQVISHGSTLGYRDPAVDIRQVGRELGVRYVVRGAMRRQGAHLRLTTELADAGTGAVVWARSHDTSATLDFADQDRLVAQIVNTLAPRVQELELRRIRGMRPEGLTVYDKVLLAREHLLTLRREEYESARLLLGEVIVTEPGYGEAYALLADYFGIAMTQGWLADRTGTIRTVGELTQKALELDRDNCRALMFQAHRQSLLHRDFPEAMRLFDQALRLWPGSAHCWAWSSYTWAYVSEAQEAIRRVGRALELSPRDREAHQFHSALCVAHYVAGNFAEAADWGRRAAVDPAVLRATLRWTAASLVAAGEVAEAREMMQRAMREIPGQTVGEVIRNSPLRDEATRRTYGAHLLAAGFPQSRGHQPGIVGPAPPPHPIA